MNHRRSARWVGLLAASTLALTACSGGGNSTSADVQDGSDMDALIAAAQEEGDLVAYWHSSRI